MDNLEINRVSDINSLKGIKMGSLNIRSVFKNLDELTLLLSQSRLDILLLQETFLNSSVPDHYIEIDNYILHRCDRMKDSGKSSGGGLCAFVHKRLNIKINGASAHPTMRPNGSN